MLAFTNGRLVGTGSLMPEGSQTGRIARMHTTVDKRRTGVASAVLEHLESRAQRIGFSTIVLETNTDWYEAIAFYQSHGYEEQHRNRLGVHFEKRVS